MGAIKNGVRPLLLDVGFAPEAQRRQAPGNFYILRQSQNLKELMIGKKLNGLHNAIRGDQRPPKLVAPELSYILKKSDELAQLQSTPDFKPFVSFARGGLGAAWGCGLFRGSQFDFKHLPLKVEDLDPYFDQLTRIVGISGRKDDLEPYFGPTNFLQKPLRLSNKANSFLEKYRKKNKKLNKQGLFAGYSRLGVLSEEKDGRSAFEYHNREMWDAENPALYNPFFTIKKMSEEGKADYKPGWFVKDYRVKAEHIEVIAESVEDGSIQIVVTKKLILAAGTINTASLVLASKKDNHATLPLFDNPLFKIPLIMPQYIGSKLQTDGFGMTQLNLVFDFKELELLLQGSVIELSSPARGALYEMFPLSAKGNLALVKYLAPAAMVLFLYFPIRTEEGGKITWTPEGVKIEGYKYNYSKAALKKVLRLMRSLGIIALGPLVQPAMNGYAIHYAGSLPMKEKPTGPYECDLNGQLGSERGVYIADGSLFSALPAKNHSFIMMANAMRVGDHASQGIIE